MPTIEERIKKRREHLASAESRLAAGDKEDAAYFEKLADQEMEEIRAEAKQAPFQGYQPDLMSRAADWWKKPRPEKLESPVPLPEEQTAPPLSEPLAPPSEQRPGESLEEQWGVPIDWEGRDPEWIARICLLSPEAQGCDNKDNYLRARRINEEGGPTGAIQQLGRR